jgi:endonuclease III
MSKKRVSPSTTGTKSGSGKSTSTKNARKSDPKKTFDQKTLHLQAASIVQQLNADFPDAQCALVHGTPFQLLIATILSAQCTDERVNLVCKELFRRYRKPADFATAPVEEIEEAVKSTGFFRNKSKNIKACCSVLVDQHGGQVPPDLDILVTLPGVGRKTANVVLGTAFGIPTGVVVDTHVGRLSNRMGLSEHTDPVKIEQDLMQLLPQEEWIGFSHRMILHGRQVCAARKPACDRCSLEKLCPKVGVK